MSDVPAKQVTPFTEDEHLEIDAVAYFEALEALEEAERRAAKKGLTRAQIAEITGMDPSRVSKVLGGASPNITLRTLFLLMKAMGEKVFIKSQPYESLAAPSAATYSLAAEVPTVACRVYVDANTIRKYPAFTSISAGSAAEVIKSIELQANSSAMDALLTNTWHAQSLNAVAPYMYKGAVAHG